MIRFIRRWLVELVAAAAALLGLFLLFEQSDISETLWSYLAGIWMWIARRIGQVGATVHLSDMLGIGFLALAVVLLVRRSGQKLRQSPEWSARACPVCGHSLRRSKRRPGDVLAWVLPLRRFRCRNCGWSGLRARPSEHEELAEPLPSRGSH
jgi:hypothetical protein